MLTGNVVAAKYRNSSAPRPWSGDKAVIVSFLLSFSVLLMEFIYIYISNSKS